MFIDKTTNAAFNFKAPGGMTEDSVNEVLFPASKAQDIVPAAGVAAATIKQMVNFIDLGELDAACTLNLTVDAQVTAGAILQVKALSDATARDLTFGTKITAPVCAGVISKTKVTTFIYDGTDFVAVGAPVQID